LQETNKFKTDSMVKQMSVLQQQSSLVPSARSNGNTKT
jgi:hypothetical protein